MKLQVLTLVVVLVLGLATSGCGAVVMGAGPADLRDADRQYFSTGEATAMAPLDLELEQRDLDLALLQTSSTSKSRSSLTSTSTSTSKSTSTSTSKSFSSPVDAKVSLEAKREQDLQLASRRLDTNVESSDEGLRSADIELMESKLGISDLGTGSAGGALVARLLGANSLKVHGDSHYSTVYSAAKRAIWQKRHEVLVEEENSLAARNTASVEASRDAPTRKEIRDARKARRAARRAARKIPDFHKLGFKFDADAVVNGTFLFNNTRYDVKDFPRRRPPLRRLIPLLRFYDGEHKDHISNTDPYEFSDRQGSYQFQGVVAFVYSRRIRRSGEVRRDSGLVPFYRYWNKAQWPTKSDHFFSLDPNLNGADLVRQGIVGFLYQNKTRSLVPLNEMLCAETGDHLYTVSRKKELKLNGNNFKFQKVLGYVQPLDALARLKARRERARRAKQAADDAARNAAKTPEPLAPPKKAWYPGQPLFINNINWSK